MADHWLALADFKRKYSPIKLVYTQPVDKIKDLIQLRNIVIKATYNSFTVGLIDEGLQTLKWFEEKKLPNKL